MSLPRSRGLRRSDTLYTAPLKGGDARSPRGFVYSDAWVDDARLTVLNAVDAAANGAKILVQTALVSARREGNLWHATLANGREIAARAMVNAAGPWVHQMLGKLGVNAASGVRLIKGSHIVVPQLFEGPQAYILQQPDRRIVFAIPYENGFTEIGTTDVPVDAPEDAVIDEGEIAYLCEAVNRHFVKQVCPADISSTWSGVRPLYDDGASEAKEVTRDYVLELDTNGPVLLSIFGGKITTARHLAEEAIAKLSRPMGFAAKRVTRTRPFPGGDIGDFAAYLAVVRKTWPFLGAARSDRMARAYGSMLGEMLAGITGEAGMGVALGGGLTAIEACWMYDREWARTPEDALHRRSKIGLHLSDDERAAFETWWASAYPA